LTARNYLISKRTPHNYELKLLELNFPHKLYCMQGLCYWVADHGRNARASHLSTHLSPYRPAARLGWRFICEKFVSILSFHSAARGYHRISAWCTQILLRENFSTSTMSTRVITSIGRVITSMQNTISMC